MPGHSVLAPRNQRRRRDDGCSVERIYPELRAARIDPFADPDLRRRARLFRFRAASEVQSGSPR